MLIQCITLFCFFINVGHACKFFLQIHRKKQINGVVASHEESRCAHKAGATVEKWDLDYIMKDKVEQRLSFEDLLRAANSKSERTAIVNDVESMESMN